MPEYFALPCEDQHEALLVVAERSGRPCTCARSKAIRQRLAELVSDKLAPDLAKALAEQGLQPLARAEGEQIFIDYRAAVTGALDLAPCGDARRTLAEDCQRMVEGGLLLDDANPSTSCCSVARRLRSR